MQTLVPDNIARPVLLTLTQFAGKASKLGSVGLLLLGITALALMLTIDRTLNNIWRVPRPRPLAQRLLVYWAALSWGRCCWGPACRSPRMRCRPRAGWSVRCRAHWRC